MKIFGLYVSPHRDFRADIARECYGLTHEFVRNRLYGEYQHGTPQARATLMDLDQDMKAFVKTQTVPKWYIRLKRRIRRGK
jgi:hypothetical protein